mmetsp:Transcript_5884/g.14213  ORF Transcript_5884/g.14213 Transcript_5884/m.14213 type:complete len:927 (+) Transcript_5884:348-3128(+)
MVTAEIENPGVTGALAPESESQSFSCPSSSLSFEEPEEDEKGGDCVSLSTASISTNPTPDNPLYSSRGGLVSQSVKEHKTVMGETKVSATTSSDFGAADGISGAVEEITRTTRNLEIKDDENIEMDPHPNNGKSIDYSSCLPASDVPTIGLHEDFNNSPEPVIKRQMHQTPEVKPTQKSQRLEQLRMKSSVNDDSENDNSGNSNTKNSLEKKKATTITTATTAADMDGDERDKLIQSRLDISTPISPLGAGSPIGASFVLRNTSTENLNKTNLSNTFSTPPRTSSSFFFHDDDSKSSTFFFTPQYSFTKIAYAISRRVFDDATDDFAVATWLGFWAYLNVSCTNLILKPIMDAVVLELGVKNQPKLILASSFLAFLSSVPIGWLFEAPDPKRRKVFKKMGMTRGETQGTSLALFYRLFAFCAVSYAIGFKLVDIEWIFEKTSSDEGKKYVMITFLFKKWYQCVYMAFFLVIHLMKLHSTSLVWGVTTEAMEYEEIARKQHENASRLDRRGIDSNPIKTKKEKTRLQRLARIQLGGTLGSIWGSTLTSSLAETLHLPGLLVVSAVLLELSAELSIELGRIMQKHWEEQQLFKSTQDLTSLDPSMKRVASSGSMKRVASSNTLYSAQQQSMKRVASGNSIHSMKRVASGNSIHSANKLSNDSLASMANLDQQNKKPNEPVAVIEVIDDNTFTQRLLRGVTCILKSRLLMTIFMYNALFSSINTLLSFQRAELVANRKKFTTVSADTAFLANINFVSSIAMFAMQSSGTGSFITQMFGTRGSLVLMPLIRLGGLVTLCWWHRSQNGMPPNLTLFLMLDEFTKVINQAVAKPVRESLWSDLNSEARYEAKPIIDVLANRWGAGSASFCVYVVSRLLLFLGQTTDDSANPVVLGLPPVLFLGLIVSAWWVGVSLDLGQLRARIDMELKKLK